MLPTLSSIDKVSTQSTSDVPADHSFVPASSDVSENDISQNVVWHIGGMAVNNALGSRGVA